MHRQPVSDEAVIDLARRRLALRRKFRWIMFLYALVFLGGAVYFSVLDIRHIKGTEWEQLTMGFANGLALAAVWATFGLIGALCLGKALAGFDTDFRREELLVTYYDRLRDLGQLSEGKILEK